MGEEDVIGLVLRFEALAADGGVGASQVSWFPGFVQRAEGVVLGELRAGGGVDGLGGRKAFEIPESVEGLDNFLGVAEDGDGVGLEAGAGSLAGFELAVEDEGGIEEFCSREAEGGAKEDLGRPAPGECHEGHAFFEVAVAGQEGESFLNEDLRVEWNEVGLIPVDALVVGQGASAAVGRKVG